MLNHAKWSPCAKEIAARRSGVMRSRKLHAGSQYHRGNSAWLWAAYLVTILKANNYIINLSQNYTLYNWQHSEYLNESLQLHFKNMKPESCMVTVSQMFSVYYTTRSWLLADVPLHHRCLVVTILQDHDCCCNTSRCSPSQMNFQWLLYYKIMIAIAIQNVQWLLTVRSWLLLQYKMFSGYKLQDHDCYCNTSWCSPSQMKVQWLLTVRSCLLLQYKMFSGYKLQDHDCYIAIQDVQWLLTQGHGCYWDTRCSVVTNCKVMVVIVIQDVQWLLTARSWLLLQYKQMFPFTTDV